MACSIILVLTLTVFLATDQNGCSDNIDIVINENPELILQIDNTQGVECNTTSTGFIETTPIGGVANYTLNWTDNNGIPTMMKIYLI